MVRAAARAVAAPSGLDLDGFLGHKTSGSGGSFLKNWKKDGSITVAIHRTAPIYPLWSHGWHEGVEVEDKDGEKAVKVFSRRFVCHERELILKKQRFRDPKGEREYPPELCPACLLDECVYQMVERGDLSWLDPVFEFKGDDPEYDITVYAGGMTGMFQSKDVNDSKSKQQELRKAGIRRDEAFRQNMLCRCQYVLSVADVEDPSAGVQTTIESLSLGMKLQAAIKKEVKRRKEKGSPARHPYPFLWEYDENASFDDKYDVTALEDALPPAVLALLGTGDPEVDRKSGSIPDLTDYVTPGNCLSFRAQVEAHLVDGISLPLDDIFGPAEEAGLMKESESPKKERGKSKAGGGRPHEVRGHKDEPEDEEEESDDEEEDEDSESAEDAPAPKGTAKQEAFDVGTKPAEPAYDCDHCGAAGAMTKVDLACPKCGATYDDKTGALDGRPCIACLDAARRGKGGAVIVVPLKPGEDRAICEKCGAVHEQFYPEGVTAADAAPSWRVVPKEEPKPAPAEQGRRRRSSAVEPAPEPEPARKEPKAARKGTKAAAPKA